MPGGEVQLVAYGEENMFLNDDPQITFFKIVYRRYTNFSIETVQTNFIYQPYFGRKMSCEISKLGDLLHKMWLVIELPNLPILYDYANNIDPRLKFAWARKIAYAIIDYCEIEIGGQVIDRKWGEWLNVLNELNVTLYNSSLDQYIGNIPELYTLQNTSNGIPSYTLHVPMFFWFCNNSGCALPLLCLEYNTIRFNIQLNNFDNCGIFSPSNYIKVSKYYGSGILAEPLVQYSQFGVAWGEFDSISVGDVDPTTMEILNYNLYYRKISDNSFITTVQTFFNNYFENNLSDVINKNTNKINYIIYGLNSGSIYVPIGSDPSNPNSINLEQVYLYKNIVDIALKNMFLLIDFIYLDREERVKFYKDKHEYVIEQIYFSGNSYLTNLNNKNNIDMLNPCKWLIFMGQISYLTNPNVNDNFNYKTTFIRNAIGEIQGDSVINTAGFTFNSSTITQQFPMSYYNYVQPFNYFPMAKVPDGYGISTFCLYPINIQPSGSCNMSCFNTFDINTNFNPIDISYSKYIFKSYAVTYNILRIVHGVSGTVFNSNYN